MLAEIEKDSHALKTLFDVTFCDEEDKPLNWTKGLVLSTNYPTFSFQVEDQQSGTTRGYSGWAMPESLSLSMLETRQHDLEKYLLKWAFGEHGIFDLNKSTFRAVDKDSWLYRKVILRTTYYEVKKSGFLSHVAIDISNAAEYAITTIIDALAGNTLSVMKRQEVKAAAKEFSKFAVNGGQGLSKPPLFNQQAIPLVDKLAFLTDTVVNNTTARVPLVRTAVPPLTTPRPVMKVPVSVNTNLLSTTSKLLSFQKPPLVGKSQGTGDNASYSQKFGIKTLPSSQKIPVKASNTAVAKAAIKKCVKQVDAILKKLPKAEAKEKTTASNTYRVALRSYTVDNYDYSTGGAVSYSIELPLIDYIKPDFK